ncbi:synaptic vesicle 2-related protein-like [Bolinopsis microptera]|uniref:synaptic vesicle 2-related protein-like n=1 Tax=Bolinopsis microptera TaxID=2820187 RepID=UPI00307AE55D
MADETQDITADRDNSPTEYYGSTSQKSDENILELEEIYEMIGLGPTQYLYWLMVLLVVYSDYAELTLLSVILPILRCEWGLSTTFETAITITVYGSYALLAAVFGRVADIYGRKKVVIWSTMFLLLAAFLGATSSNKWVFLVSRLFTGACIGINTSVVICYATEIAESRYRTYGVTTVVLGSFVGVAAVNGMAFLFLQIVGWRWFIMLVSTPALPALVLILVLPESPRFLCVSGQQDKAMEAVRTMANLNGRELPGNIQMACFDNEELGSYSTVLNKEHRKSIIALSVIYFSNLLIEFGLIVLLPLIFSSDMCGASHTVTHECRLLSQDDLWKITIATVGSIFGTIAALFLAERIGRLVPIRVASFVMLLSIGCMFVCVNETFTFVTSTIAKIVEAFINVTVWIMIPESFPTNIRSTATGFINGWGKAGGVLGTALVYLLFYVSPYSVLGFFLFFSLVGFVAILIYDRETKYEVLREI